MNRIFLNFLLLGLVAALIGCGGTDSGSNIGATTTLDVDEGARPQVSTIRMNFALARQVPQSVTQFRFTGLNGNQTLFGSVVRDKAEVITISEVPVSVTVWRIEYLMNGAVLVGTTDIALDLIGGETITINDPDFTTVTTTAVNVTPINATVSVGATSQLTATASFSNGSTSDVTNNATWSSSNPSVASVSSTGGVTGITQGAANITATFSGQSGATQVTVTP